MDWMKNKWVWIAAGVAVVALFMIFGTGMPIVDNPN